MPLFLTQNNMNFTSQNIKNLFLNDCCQDIAERFQPKTVAEILGFKDALRLTYRLLYNAKWEEALQQYAIQLICVVKEIFVEEWEKDWRFEAFLGSAYHVILGDDSYYDQRYNAYMRAFNKANPVPPELLIALAKCVDAPGKPPVSYDEAIELAKKSLELEPYAAAAGILCSVYFCKGQEEDSKIWAKVRDQLSSKGPPPPLEPPFVREGYK